VDTCYANGRFPRGRRRQKRTFCRRPVNREGASWSRTCRLPTVSNARKYSPIVYSGRPNYCFSRRINCVRRVSGRRCVPPAFPVTSVSLLRFASVRNVLITHCTSWTARETIAVRTRGHFRIPIRSFVFGFFNVTRTACGPFLSPPGRVRITGRAPEIDSTAFFVVRRNSAPFVPGRNRNGVSVIGARYTLRPSTPSKHRGRDFGPVCCGTLVGRSTGTGVKGKYPFNRYVVVPRKMIINRRHSRNTGDGFSQSSSADSVDTGHGLNAEMSVPKRRRRQT